MLKHLHRSEVEYVLVAASDLRCSIPLGGLTVHVATDVRRTRGRSHSGQLYRGKSVSDLKGDGGNCSYFEPSECLRSSGTTLEAGFEGERRMGKLWGFGAHAGRLLMHLPSDIHTLLTFRQTHQQLLFH